MKIYEVEPAFEAASFKSEATAFSIVYFLYFKAIPLSSRNRRDGS
jgi:hypothetical protein